MLGNILVETIVGTVPVLGDIFDFAWQANIKNLRLAEKHDLAFYPFFLDGVAAQPESLHSAGHGGASLARIARLAPAFGPLGGLRFLGRLVRADAAVGPRPLASLPSWTFTRPRDQREREARDAGVHEPGRGGGRRRSRSPGENRLVGTAPWRS